MNMMYDAPQEADVEREQRLVEALKELRKEAKYCIKYEREYLKKGLLYEYIEMREWRGGITWAVDTLEYYLENGR